MGRFLVALSVLSGLVVYACARPSPPPGGPGDARPPVVIETDPDTFEVILPGRDELTIRFNERISERTARVPMSDAVQISPVTGDISVKHSRDALRVEIAGGLKPGLVYRVSVQPVIQDMFGNTLRDPFEFIFSTGPTDFAPNVLAGSVTDRITGTAVRGASVHAVQNGVEDGTYHVAVTDSAGIYIFRYLPPGAFTVMAFEDVNRNREVDFREAQGTSAAQLASADTLLLPNVSILTPDTTAAQVGSAVAVDSMTVQVTVDDYLDPELPLDGVAGVVWEAPPSDVDTTTVLPQADSLRSTRVLHSHEYEAYSDSVQAAAAAAADTVPPDLEPVGAEVPPGTAPASEEEPEDPLPSREFWILLDRPLQSGVVYRVRVAGIRNINEVAGGGGEVEFLWEAPEPVVAPPDTAGVTVPPDTGSVVWMRPRRP